MEELTLTAPQFIAVMTVLIVLLIKSLKKSDVIEFKVPKHEEKQWEWKGAYLQNAYKRGN